jgi:hypothetical protein
MMSVTEMDINELVADLDRARDHPNEDQWILPEPDQQPVDDIKYNEPINMVDYMRNYHISKALEISELLTLHQFFRMFGYSTDLAVFTGAPRPFIGKLIYVDAKWRAWISSGNISQSVNHLLLDAITDCKGVMAIDYTYFVGAEYTKFRNAMVQNRAVNHINEWPLNYDPFEYWPTHTETDDRHLIVTMGAFITALKSIDCLTGELVRTYHTQYAIGLASYNKYQSEWHIRANT